MKSLSSGKLAKLLQSDSPPRVLDVRLADDHQAIRIPGSVHNCVFEIAFRERLPESAPDKQQAIVIYGASEKSAEAGMAAEKLERAGYTEVLVLKGGIRSWHDDDHPVEQGPSPAADPSPPHGRFDLNLDECRLEWIGRNLINRHYGTVDLSSGHLDFKKGDLTGGCMEFDFKTLKCADLADTELHDVLIRHLQDHDFLDVEKHPTGRLVITSSFHVPDATPGSPNLMIKAELTLRGKTKPIEFTATGGPGPDGNPAAQAAFSIDRTEWGILYGSGRFFDRLAGHLVNDLVEFQARILTKSPDSTE
ncbi:YceI family protein [Haloferula sp.]|uniref:YceI family protein n=1 Tax=Haloferula sp. TaxID=2497595 RepID=UPI003C77DE5D